MELIKILSTYVIYKISNYFFRIKLNKALKLFRKIENFKKYNTVFKIAKLSPKYDLSLIFRYYSNSILYILNVQFDSKSGNYYLIKKLRMSGSEYQFW